MALHEYTQDLARLVGTFDTDEEPNLSYTLEVAQAYVFAEINRYTTVDSMPQVIIKDCILTCAADLWQARDARNGVMTVSADGIEPYRISSDPLRAVRPKLKAAGLPIGLGIA